MERPYYVLPIRTRISYRFIKWLLDENIDIFTTHKESLGFV